jgi:hypothetical protein
MVLTAISSAPSQYLTVSRIVEPGVCRTILTFSRKPRKPKSQMFSECVGRLARLDGCNVLFGGVQHSTDQTFVWLT